MTVVLVVLWLVLAGGAASLAAAPLQPAGEVRDPAMPMEGGSFAAAVHRLALRSDLGVPGALVPVLPDLSQLPAYPAATDAALAGVVEAFLALADASLAPGNGPDPTHPATLAAVAGAQAGLVAAAQALGAVLPAAAERGAIPPLDLPGLVAVDLRDHANRYTAAYVLLVDAGGDDAYLNHAGAGGMGLHCFVADAPQAAALLDLAGDDSYGGDPSAPWQQPCARNGGAGWGGVGFLYDAAGDDVYTGSLSASNGGGVWGHGFLLDEAGDDTYVAGRLGVNGGAYIGSGSLIDRAGDDHYRVVRWDVTTSNGGAQVGRGLLLDLQGRDRYQVGFEPVRWDQSFYPKGVVGAQLDL